MSAYRVPFAHAQAAIRQPSASLRRATVKSAPVCVICLPCQFECHGRRHDDIGTVAGDVVMQWLAECDHIAGGTVLLTFDQHVSVPILSRRWPLPYVRCHAVKD